MRTLSCLLPKKNSPSHTRRNVSLWAAEQSEIRRNVRELCLKLELVDCRSSALWNEFIDRYHYLGYKALPGAQMRYFVKAKVGPKSGTTLVKFEVLDEVIQGKVVGFCSSLIFSSF